MDDAASGGGVPTNLLTVTINPARRAAQRERGSIGRRKRNAVGG